MNFRRPTSAMGNGERIWCQARIPHDITIAGTEDKNLSYLMFCVRQPRRLKDTKKMLFLGKRA